MKVYYKMLGCTALLVKMKCKRVLCYLTVQRKMEVWKWLFESLMGQFGNKEVRQRETQIEHMTRHFKFSNDRSLHVQTKVLEHR